MLTVTIPRFVLALGIGLAMQGTVFVVYYDDLLYLRRGASALSTAETTTFVTMAERALSRRSLTVTHIETLAQAAREQHLMDIEVRALERGILLQPDDIGSRLRLADALRRSGDLARAEAIYEGVLALTGHPSR
jgi:hypothetical protein